MNTIQYIRSYGYKRMTSDEFISLAHRIIDGDAEAKNEFIVRSAFMVAWIIKRHGYIYTDDLMSIGLSAVARCVSSDRITPETFFNYVYSWVRYSILSEVIRVSKHNGNASINDEIGDNGTLEDIIADARIDDTESISRMDFEYALCTLNRLEREIIDAWCFHGLTLNDIAERIGMKLVNVSSIKDSALKKIAKHMGNYVSAITEAKVDNKWDFILSNI